jgi:hypothetical protein
MGPDDGGMVMVSDGAFGGAVCGAGVSPGFIEATGLFTEAGAGRVLADGETRQADSKTITVKARKHFFILVSLRRKGLSVILTSGLAHLHLPVADRAACSWD